MRPDSSRGPDDRHGAHGKRGLSAAGGRVASRQQVCVCGCGCGCSRGREGRAVVRAWGGVGNRQRPRRVCTHDNPQMCCCPSACSVLESPIRKWRPRAKLLPDHGVGGRSAKALGEQELRGHCQRQAEGWGGWWGMGRSKGFPEPQRPHLWVWGHPPHQVTNTY